MKSDHHDKMRLLDALRIKQQTQRDECRRLAQQALDGYRRRREQLQMQQQHIEGQQQRLRDTVRPQAILSVQNLLLGGSYLRDQQQRLQPLLEAEQQASKHLQQAQEKLRQQQAQLKALEKTQENRKRAHEDRLRRLEQKQNDDLVLQKRGRPTR